MNIFYSLYFFGSTLNYICVYIEITSQLQVQKFTYRYCPIWATYKYKNTISKKWGVNFYWKWLVEFWIFLLEFHAWVYYNLLKNFRRFINNNWFLLINTPLKNVYSMKIFLKKSRFFLLIFSKYQNKNVRIVNWIFFFNEFVSMIINKKKNISLQINLKKSGTNLTVKYLSLSFDLSRRYNFLRNFCIINFFK